MRDKELNKDMMSINKTKWHSSRKLQNVSKHPEACLGRGEWGDLIDPLNFSNEEDLQLLKTKWPFCVIFKFSSAKVNLTKRLN